MAIANRHARTTTIVCVVLTLSLLPTGCTTAHPVYDDQGRYVGTREEFDAGKTLSGLGDAMLLLTPFGKNAQAAIRAAQYGHALRAAGNAASTEHHTAPHR